MAIRALISGSGKMGRAIAEGLRDRDDVIAVGCVDKLAGGSEFEALPLFDDAARAIEATKPDVFIDFTNAAWTPLLVKEALPRGVRPIIGTTGLSEAFVDDLARECAERRLGGVLAPNFSIGAVLLMHMAALAARHFDAAEIIELHHETKVDAPSGTALATARAMAAARGRDFARNEPAQTPLAHTRDGALAGITLHSVRLPGMVAHQEVLLGAPGQTLTIRHDTTGRDCYLPGIILAGEEAMKRNELVVGLAPLLGLTS